MVEYSGGNPLPATRNEVEVDAWTEDWSFVASLRTTLGNSSCDANDDDELSITGRCSCTVGALSGHVHDQSPCDGKNNTYSCVRTLTQDGGPNTMYCEFNDPEQFVEFYNLDTDPYNLHNLAITLRNSTQGRAKLAAMHSRLLDHQACTGSDCFDPPHRPPTKPSPRYQDPSSKLCLGFGSDDKMMFALQDCGKGAAVQWVQGKDKNGFGQFLNVEENKCLNIQNKQCDGGMVHLFDCQGTDTKVHTANHFHFNASTNEIMSECCQEPKCVRTNDGVMTNCGDHTTWTQLG